jgi:DNA-binding transcriptional ArsR family regulator
MSVRMMAKVWELDLPQPLKLLALALADVADDEGGNIYPSKAFIARKVGAHPRTIQRQMAELEERGIIKVERRRGHRLASGQWTRLLRLHPERGDKLPPLVWEGETPRVERGDTGNHKGRQSYVSLSVRDPLEIPAAFEIEELEIPRLPGETASAYLRRISGR